MKPKDENRMFLRMYGLDENYKSIEKQNKFNDVAAPILLVLVIYFLFAFIQVILSPKAESAELINIDTIIQIESSGNPLAFNRATEARGLCQITPICLKEYNNFHPKQQYSKDDLFNAEINKNIAVWYFKRIGQMLRHYNKPESIENYLISYNAGISYVVNNKPLPAETVNYINKYKRGVNNGL